MCNRQIRCIIWTLGSSWYKISYLPQNIIDTYDALFVRIFCVADQSCTRLHPRVSTVFVHDPIVVAHHLPLVEHCNVIMRNYNSSNLSKVLNNYYMFRIIEVYSTYSLREFSSSCEHLLRGKEHRETARLNHRQCNQEAQKPWNYLVRLQIIAYVGKLSSS